MNAEKIGNVKTEEIKESAFYIKDMDCPDCAMKVEKSIRKLYGVEKSVVNFSTAKLFVNHTPGIEDKIIKELEQIGHPGELIEKRKKQVESIVPWYLSIKTIMTWVSGIFLMIGLLLALFNVHSNLSSYLYILSIVIGGYHVGKSGLYSLKSLSLDMNALMLIAVVGAGILGEWVEGAAVVFLFSLGNTLQTYTMDKTRKSIKKLMELAPNEALKKTETGEIVVAVEELRIKDIVIIKPGERIPIDGSVIKGNSDVDQSPITGESVPVFKNLGDEIYAGTINGKGLMEIEVTKLAENTTLAKILTLVEEAQNQKAPMEQWVDKFSRYYTPMVVVLAVGVALIPPVFFQLPLNLWFKKAIILLVIACPCALVISTPVSIVSAIGNAAKQGILIKGGVYLEEFGRVKAMAFDKTGTLTTGKPIILEAVAFNSQVNALKIAANIEKGSEHPIGNAFLKKASDEGIILDLNIDELRDIPGKGVIAKLEGVKYLLGNELLIKESGIKVNEHSLSLDYYQEQGKTLIFLANSTEVISIFVIADKVREESKDIASKLKKLGIDHLYMLSGDHNNTAKAVADEIGFKNYIGQLLPEDKLEIVKKLLKKHERVVMVGDGINDTPSLSLATVGVAMGVTGSDAALETANIALMGDDLNKLSYTVELSRKTLRIIKQNIFFSISIKFLFIVLTILGLSTLWMAVFADTGAAVIVILNSMRLLKFKTE